MHNYAMQRWCMWYLHALASLDPVAADTASCCYLAAAVWAAREAWTAAGSWASRAVAALGDDGGVAAAGDGVAAAAGDDAAEVEVVAEAVTEDARDPSHEEKDYLVLVSR